MQFLSFFVHKHNVTIFSSVTSSVTATVLFAILSAVVIYSVRIPRLHLLILCYALLSAFYRAFAAFASTALLRLYNVERYSLAFCCFRPSADERCRQRPALHAAPDHNAAYEHDERRRACRFTCESAFEY